MTVIAQLSNAPDVIVAAGTTAGDATPITSTDTMVDASAGAQAGVRLPRSADAWENTPDTLVEPQSIRLISLGPAAVHVYPATGDQALSDAGTFGCPPRPCGSAVRINVAQSSPPSIGLYRGCDHARWGTGLSAKSA